MMRQLRHCTPYDLSVDKRGDRKYKAARPIRASSSTYESLATWLTANRASLARAMIARWRNFSACLGSTGRMRCKVFLARILAGVMKHQYTLSSARMMRASTGWREVMALR